MLGPITFTGLASGIDTQAIVERLMQIERQPLVLIQQRQDDVEDRLDLFQDLRSRMSSLDSAVQTLNLLSTVAAKSASSSNTTALGVTANSTASAGNFSVDSISQLATAASEASIGIVDSSATFASGSSFSFDVGSTSYSITLEASEQTLEGLRDAINAEAGDDVAATILNTGDATDPYKLVIRSNETGADNDISNISTDIQVTTSGGDVALSFVGGESVEGADAQFKISGVSISRGSNTVSDVIEGITLVLKATASSAITVTVAKNTDTLKSALNDFIDKYNEVNSLIQSQFSYDVDNGSAGTLSGDFTLRQVQSTLQSIVIGGVVDADGNRYSLASIGVEVDKYSGDLSLNETTFNTAAANDDKELFIDLLLARGVPTDSRVSFVTSSSSTEAGTYSINVTGYDGEGNVEGTFTLNGDVFTGVGDGQVLVGPDGTAAEGLQVRIASGVTGALGDLYFSVGVAEQMERVLDDLLTPIVGLLPVLESRLEGDIADMSNQIEAFEERLATRERELLMQFIAAEQAISMLQSQTAAFQAQLNTIGGGGLL